MSHLILPQVFTNSFFTVFFAPKKLQICSRIQTMKKALLTILRDKSSSRSQFRRASDKLSELIAAEIAEELTLEEISVATPLANAQGHRLTQKVVLIPILRAGIALLPAFMRLFDESRIGFLGVRRDENTAKAYQYYENIPPLSNHEIILVLDPMIATGGSALLALQKLKERGAHLAHIFLISVIASTPGIQAVKALFPEINIRVVSEDQALNDKKFIIPGLGDFGDRYFGTTN
jgi:uracil phosphoribosyltransferase